MPLVNQYPDSNPNFPHYWLRVSKFSQAVRNEGTIISYSDGDDLKIAFPNLQEAAPDFPAAMIYSEDFVAKHLQVDEISLNWYPCLGKNPTYLWESWVRMGDQSNYPEKLHCYVSNSYNAWKAIVYTVTADHELDELRYEACRTLEDGMAWCEEVVANWLHVDRALLLWNDWPLTERWKAVVRLRYTWRR